MTVAVVGAGIAGAAGARALAASGVDVRVVDRGRAAGGRMASRTLAGRLVDVGASYLTARDERFAAVVGDWTQRGLARAWTDAFHVAGATGLGDVTSGPVRYGAAHGLRSLVVDLLAELPLATGTEVARVGPGPTIDGTSYDAVVLALPDPQAERLLDGSLVEERARVAGRTWEPVLALAAGWDERGWDAAFDGCFVQDDPALGWIADDGRRRGDGAPVLVAHSTSPYAERHLDAPAGATADLVAGVRRVLRIDRDPTWTHVQRWSSARPAEAREQPFHLGSSRVGLCGDGWGSPRVETAWLSGHLLGQQLGEVLSVER